MPRVAAILVLFVLAACGTSPSTTIDSSIEPTAASTATPAPSAAPPATPPAPTAPSSTPGPPATAVPTTSAPPPEPEPTLPPIFGPATLATTGDPVPNSDLGGCGSLRNEDELYGADGCGPHEFNLDAEPVVVAPGGTMTFAAPEGYLFSIDQLAANPDAAGVHSWAIAIAPVTELIGLPEGEQETITAEHGGRVLGYGDRAVISAWVKAPLARGEYLVQLDASVNLGPWTFTWPRFFWRVSVQ